MAEIYLSFDIESDGPSPVDNSLLSIAVVPVLYLPETATVEVWGQHTLEVNLETREDKHPDRSTLKFWEQYPERYAETREEVVRPKEAMARVLAHYYENVGRLLLRCAQERLPMTRPSVHYASRPATFDFHWLRHYMMEYAAPAWVALGYPSFTAIDIASYIAGRLNMPYAMAAKRENWPEAWLWPNDRPHNALEDAMEQAHLLAGALRGPDEDQDRSG